MRAVSPSLSSLGLVLGAASSLGIVIGAYWDGTWHRIQLPETFWIPPHVVIYSSSAILAAVMILWLIFTRKWSFPRSLSKAYGIAVIGVGIQLFAGAFDQWWHATFGVDKALSPPHLTLIMGITVSLAAIFTGLTHSLNLAVNKSLARVIELSRVISWVCLWSVLVALLIIFVLPDPFTSLPTGTQLVILEAGFVFIALSMIFSGMKLIQLRWSATLLLGMRTLLVLYPTLIFADPKLHGLAPWFFLIITPAIPIDIARHKLMEQPSYLVVTGAALGSLFNLAFYPMNYAIYGGAVPPITLETNLLMAAVGLLGSAVGLGGVQRFHLLVPRIEPHSAQP